MSSAMGDALWAAYERGTGKRPMDPSLLTGKNSFERGDWSGPDWGQTSLKTLTGSFAQQRNARLDKMDLSYRQRYGSIGWKLHAPDHGYGMTGNESQHYRPPLPSAGTPETPAAGDSPAADTPASSPDSSGPPPSFTGTPQQPGTPATPAPDAPPASPTQSGRMGFGVNPSGRVASFRAGSGGFRPKMNVRSI